MLPIAATLGVVVVAALIVAVLNQKANNLPVEAATTPASSAAAAESVFGDIDTSPERFMRKSSGQGRPATTNNAPAGLADAPIFVEARALAKDGTDLVKAALAAEKVGDTETWRTNAIAGREKLERALEITAVWQDELSTTWGSNDVQVQQIGDEVGVWVKQLGKVRKVH